MNRGRYFWAIILILLGSLLLLNNFDLITVDVWSLFWPSLLILIGIWFLGGSFFQKPPAESEQAAISLQGADEAHVHIKHGAGRLQISGGANPDDLLSGTFGWGMEKDINRSGQRLEVLMRPAHGIFPDVIFPWTWTTGHGLDWTVACNEQIPLSFVFETGAGEAVLDLSRLRVKDLLLQTGASSTRVIAPEKAGMTTMKVEAGVASVSVEVPSGVGARIQTVGGLSSVNVDQTRFPWGEYGFQSQDYDSAENKVDIRVETGVGSVKIQ